MDPVTQGVLGATATQPFAHAKEKWVAAALGFLSGMAADLDVLIRSSSDPLLALEYHRHFTHSLIFIPIGALICALVLHRFIPSIRRTLSFGKAYLYSLAGYATHALLDACTTYGTQLFWPFSDARVAWNTVSVIDPLFTLPLIFILLLAILRKSTLLSYLAVAYVFFYMSLGLLQNHRAKEAAAELALSRGHQPTQLGVKPSFANLIAWKSVYLFDGRFYVDAIRVLAATSVIEGGSTEKLMVEKHFPWLAQSSQQAKDVERFAWFSNYHLGIDPHNPNRVIDIRYSLIPNQMTGMWGITLDPGASADAHVVWGTNRPAPSEMGDYTQQLWKLIRDGKLD